jgi:hypothetical protein
MGGGEELNLADQGAQKRLVQLHRLPEGSRIREKLRSESLLISHFKYALRNVPLVGVNQSSC